MKTIFYCIQHIETGTLRGNHTPQLYTTYQRATQSPEMSRDWLKDHYKIVEVELVIK